MLRLLPHAGNEELLQDGRWLSLLLTIRLLLTLPHLRRDWYGWHGSMGLLGAHSLCLLLSWDGAGRSWCCRTVLTFVWAGILSCPLLFTCALQEVQVTADLGAALLSEASVSPFVSSFS